jgi:hypothetical protein
LIVLQKGVLTSPPTPLHLSLALSYEEREKVSRRGLFIKGEGSCRKEKFLASSF